MTDTNENMVVGLVADLVSAYVSNNKVPPQELPDLIALTYAAITGLGSEPGTVEPERPAPAVPIKKSITPDYLICLEDGKRFKSLKRHLKASYNMTPEQYRKRWELPSDYPMVAPSYGEARSQLAKKLGLGLGRRKASAET